ncbi:4'-phosphopantetheinyl transferase family protein [Myceligenerans salitolerans]|uniref:4'-phosphopantetheinyl transferase superfamily protein n=1 Tax=Myceligenerans salitolerans TaxID=1230528 RepID=A0ABS3IE51_9MICO|nr:4'-phosphopantetheinyl transferase superfamily protein [Myceligenerans salitolerans]MBO0611228.1 4'-phosphopantetheinyl transferase superfamily protein [Myceligenerans salitolerans]
MTAECRVWLLRGLPEWPVPERALDGSERQRYRTLRRPDDRGRFLTGTLLAKAAVAGHLGVDPYGVTFARDCARCGAPHGKPVAVGQPVHFSIAHSQRVVAVALSTHAPVGVDVEFHSARHPAHDAVVGCLDAEERPRSDAQHLYTYWCRKEAVVKATGDGLRTPLSEVVVGRADQPARLTRYRGDSPGWWLADLDVGRRYSGAVAMLHTGATALRVLDGAQLLRSTYGGS